MNLNDENQEHKADPIAAAAAADQAAPFNLSDLLKDPEIYQTAVNFFMEAGENLGDIAPQVELLSRSNLAKSFISFNNESQKFDFDNAAFENCWKFLTKD